MARMWIALAAGQVLLAACATRPAGPAHGPEPTFVPEPPPTVTELSEAAPETEPGGLRLEVSPAAAEVEINGEPLRGDPLARALAGKLVLNPGLYRIVLRHPGFQTWRGEFAVTGGPQVLEVALTPSATEGGEP